MLKKYFVQGFLPVLLVGIFFHLPNHSHAQFYFGGKIGPSLTNVNGDFAGNNYKFGYSSGGIIGVSFGEFDQFNIQTDLLISLKGVNQKFEEKSSLRRGDILTETTLKYDNNLHLSYFEAPLTFKYSLSLGGGVFPYNKEKGPVNIDIMAGPYIGYLLDAAASFNTERTTRVVFYDDEGEVENEDVTNSELEAGKFRLKNRAKHGLKPYGSLDTFEQVNIPSSLDGSLNTLDIGLSFGAGISFELSKSSTLGLEGRYTTGFMSIDDTFFNDYKVNSEISEDGEANYDIQSNQADLTNTAFVFYLTWTYQIIPSTF